MQLPCRKHFTSLRSIRPSPIIANQVEIGEVAEYVRNRTTRVLRKQSTSAPRGS
jgi:hypothetical protein